MIYYNKLERWNSEKKYSVKTFTIVAITFIIFIPIAYAGTPSTINPGEWKPSNFNPNDMDEVVDAAGIIVSVIRTLGIIVSVIVLLIIGIKYMVGSVEERADYKTSMRPYLIGVLIFFGLSQFLAVIIDIVPGLF